MGEHFEMMKDETDALMDENAALRARAEKAEAENASLHATIRNLESRSVQAEAQAAAMRGAMTDAVRLYEQTLWNPPGGVPLSVWADKSQDGRNFLLMSEARDRIRKALSSDAGRDLLEERDELRRAVDGAIARLSEGGLADGSARVGDVVAELRTVIAAWEKRNG